MFEFILLCDSLQLRCCFLAASLLLACHFVTGTPANARGALYVSEEPHGTVSGSRGMHANDRTAHRTAEHYGEHEDGRVC